MDLPTRPSLLQRLRLRGDERDWEVFYEIYSGPIRSWSAQFGLDPDATRDVMQETMLSLTRVLREFDYDPKKGQFRGWLWRVVRNKAHEARRRCALRETSIDPSAGPAGHEQVSAEPAADEHLERLWHMELVREGLRLMSGDPALQSKNLAIFQAVMLEGRDYLDVAESFHTNGNQVRQAVFRLTKRLRRIVASLQSGDFDFPADISEEERE